MEPLRILVVDDSDNNRTIMADCLEAFGYQVLQASDGREAIEAAIRFRPRLIFMDIMMPGQDGWDTARALKADVRTRDIPILAATALDEREYRAQAVECGFDGWLQKPFPVQRILDEVQRVLRPLSPPLPSPAPRVRERSPLS